MPQADWIQAAELAEQSALRPKQPNEQKVRSETAAFKTFVRSDEYQAAKRLLAVTGRVIPIGFYRGKPSEAGSVSCLSSHGFSHVGDAGDTEGVVHTSFTEFMQVLDTNPFGYSSDCIMVYIRGQLDRIACETRRALEKLEGSSQESQEKSPGDYHRV